jgi:curved DNA-binding protein CbpA
VSGSAQAYIDPYAVLGLSRNASAPDIKQAYFTLVRQHPPERDPDMFKRIRAAYERLRDPDRRLETDMLLQQRWPAPSQKRRLPKLDLTLHHEDVLSLARMLTDLDRTDWREHFVKVKL